MPKPATAADPHAGHQSPAVADSHAGHGASQEASDPHAGHQSPVVADPHAGHGASPSAAAADPHAGHARAPASSAGTAADLPVGNAIPPPTIIDHAADGVFGARSMQRARTILEGEHGTTRIAKVMLNIAEYQSQPPGGGYRWDAEAWYGGDLNRFVFKTEGEGSGGEGVEAAEVQALYSRAVGRYTDVQVGVRHDPKPGPSRTYATVGFESLFPYWFELEGAAFLSDKGDLIGRLEGTYDLRLTQRLILQPQAELRVSAQDIPEQDVASGITHAEVGLRLRYEIRREFAPYVGVAWERALGQTADFIRAAGEDVESTTFVAGIRAWF
ncbi:copper resistance protein B [Phenylobacterium sp. VNQ135]